MPSACTAPWLSIHTCSNGASGQQQGGQQRRGLVSTFPPAIAVQVGGVSGAESRVPPAAQGR